MCTVRIVLFVFALAYIIHGGSADQYKIVDTSDGRIRGIKSTTLLKGDPFYAFKGIPYAKPPIGDLRFKAPEPSDPWEPAVLNAFQYGNICIQPGLVMPHPSPQNEDCLTLNIFVPANRKSCCEKLAVLFFIHGGGFLEGAGDDYFYGPDFIIEKQTILVTVNYRLGIFGFLSLNSTEYSGNMGLKDQQLALKWIHSNIHQFGGDNKRITIFGHSAGGASVNYHILSVESRKYFRNAIAMSGAVENPWALLPKKDHLKNAFQMAKQLGKPQNSYDELITFLKVAPADSFNQFSVIYVENAIKFNAAFGPIVERADANQPFLIDEPDEIYAASKIEVNAMFTATSHEMMSIAPKTLLTELDAYFKIPLPFRKLTLPLESQEHRSLAKQVRKFYFGDRAIDEHAVPQFFNLLGDFTFIWGIVQSAKALAAHSTGQTFYTLFSVDSKLNVWKHSETTFKRGEIFTQPGAAHGDDLCYLFRCGMALFIYDDILSNKPDEQSKICLGTIERITKLYTNFAKYDEPSHENDLGDGFRSIEIDQMHYIAFDNDGLTAGLNPHKESIEFWSNLERKARQFSDKIETNKRDEL